MNTTQSPTNAALGHIITLLDTVIRESRARGDQSTYNLSVARFGMIRAHAGIAIEAITRMNGLVIEVEAGALPMIPARPDIADVESPTPASTQAPREHAVAIAINTIISKFERRRAADQAESGRMIYGRNEVLGARYAGKAEALEWVMAEFRSAEFRAATQAVFTGYLSAPAAQAGPVAPPDVIRTPECCLSHLESVLSGMEVDQWKSGNQLVSDGLHLAVRVVREMLIKSDVEPFALPAFKRSSPETMADVDRVLDKPSPTLADIATRRQSQVDYLKIAVGELMMDICRLEINGWSGSALHRVRQLLESFKRMKIDNVPNESIFTSWIRSRINDVNSLLADLSNCGEEATEVRRITREIMKSIRELFSK